MIKEKEAKNKVEVVKKSNFWTKMGAPQSKMDSKKKPKKGGGDADLDVIDSTLKNISARINLDLVSTISSFE